MCEYTFTSLYPCILKDLVQKHLKNADASLARETDHYVGVRCFISSCRQVFSFFFPVFTQFLLPFYKISTFCRNLGLLNCLQVHSATLIEASCLAGYIIHYNFVLDFYQLFYVGQYFSSAAFYVLGEGLIKKNPCVWITENCFVWFVVVFFSMMVKNCRFFYFVISVALNASVYWCLGSQYKNFWHLHR